MGTLKTIGILAVAVFVGNTIYNPLTPLYQYTSLAHRLDWFFVNRVNIGSVKCIVKQIDAEDELDLHDFPNARIYATVQCDEGEDFLVLVPFIVNDKLLEAEDLIICRDVTVLLHTISRRRTNVWHADCNRADAEDDHENQ
jgi:hypothetical protein